MTERKFSKRTWVKTFLRCFFAVMLPITGVMGILSNTNPVFADELTTSEVKTEAEKKAETEKKKAETEKKEAGSKETESKEKENKVDGQNCFNALGEIGWLVCPGTGKIANAVDWLYEKIEGVLQINPIKMKDGEPIYEIWKYCRGITNIVFVIFMLIVIYSQITGVGISNYGLKKAMPKLIVAAILVNLSFLLCSLLVDVSNIIGAGLRGVFTSIEQTAMGSMSTGMSLKMTEVYQSLAGGTAIAVGAAAIAFETGTIWMLIPVALGAIVAVATGLITIALRQAVVMILIMISPLAVVAYILPNTEQLFERWKKLLTRMLVFYPVFSLLFGASSLAGFAIITGAKDGFGVLLGIAVQIFPLFFSWKLMKMSGTVLGTINEKIRSVASKPMAPVGNWANSHRELSKQKHLASGNVYTPSRYLTQFLADRKTSREAEIAEHSAAVKERGLAYNAMTKYARDKNGKVDTTRLSREGLPTYDMQARRMTYARTMALDKNNFNKGFGAETGDEKYDDKINALNMKNVNAADTLFAEQARGEQIDYTNAKGRYERFEVAMNANQDRLKLKDKNTGKISSADYAKYKNHFNDLNGAEYNQALERYDMLSKIMGGDVDAIHYFGAAAAASYSTQIKVVSEKYQKYFEMLPPTNDVITRLNDLTKHKDSSKYIDAIVPGLRVLNARGDTDLISEQLKNLMNENKLQLGTHASQAIASFLMMDVKDNDPTLRRFGKYINLQTAKVYNNNERKKTSVDLKEYVRGEYKEPDGTPVTVSKSMKELLDGTSFDGVERTAFANYDSLIKYAYDIPEGDEAGKKVASHKDFEDYTKRKKAIDSSIGAAFISASTKYLSGSEQLTSAVGFVSGFKKDKKTGGLIGIWEEEYNNLYDKYFDDKGHYLNEENLSDADKQNIDGIMREKEAQAKKTKEEYQEGFYNYVSKQTPAQILGFRTDYQLPLTEHLFGIFYDDTFVTDEETGEYVIDKKTGKRIRKYGKDDWTSEMKAEWIDLRTQYDNATTNGEREELKLKMASAQLQNMLATRGKLKQIHDSKRSGAANNAKDWLRKMVGLDNPESVADKLKVNNRQVEEKLSRKFDSANGGDTPSGIINGYKTQLGIYLSDNKLSIESSDKDDMIEGIKDFIDENIKGENGIALSMKFDDACNDISGDDGRAVYDIFIAVLNEFFENN